MNFTLSITKVVKAGGRVHIVFSDGISLEFSSLAQAQSYVSDLTKEVLRKLALSRYLQVDPTGANPALIEGKSISFTNESNSMVVVS